MKSLRSLLAGALLGLAGGAVNAAELAALYAPFDELLDRHLVEFRTARGGLASGFEYRAALESPRTAALLERQDRAMAAFDPQQIETRRAALAFWINAYNYFMLAWLLENPIDGEPAGSVRDYGHLLDPYALFGRDLFTIGGREYSLRRIELDILLGERFAERGWKDARVHFMVNCASVGCPALRREIYTAGNVDAMLAENTRRALDTPLHLRRAGGTLEVTSLFDWYAGDFLAEAESIPAWIARHGSEAAADAAASADNIAYIDYDWDLNTPDAVHAALERLDARVVRPDATR